MFFNLVKYIHIKNKVLLTTNNPQLSPINNYD